MAGSNNFLQFNPTLANQETDAQYLTDATRTGGAGVDAIWPSASANKTLYQLSTFVAALGAMMANKGYVISDASLATLTTVLANILTTADLPSSLQVVTWSSSLTLNAGAYSGFQIPLNGNPTIGVTGQTAGEEVTLIFVQDATGGRTVTFSSDFIGAWQPDPGASVISSQSFKVNSALKLESKAPNMSIHGINNTPIGAGGASTGAFTTPVSGDNSTSAATTAWAKYGLSMSLGTNGYVKLPNWLGGLILQWGAASISGAGVPGSTNQISFSTPFLNNCFAVIATVKDYDGAMNTEYPVIYGGSYGPTLTYAYASISGNTSRNIFWLAIGN